MNNLFTSRNKKRRLEITDKIKMAKKFSVNARDLYDAALIGTPFSTWIGARLRSNGYEPEQDYVVIPVFYEKAHCERAEVLITLEAAYCIAGNMRGSARQRRARAYLSSKSVQSAAPWGAAKGSELFAV